jgi:hypothetical protein
MPGANDAGVYDLALPAHFGAYGERDTLWGTLASAAEQLVQERRMEADDPSDRVRRAYRATYDAYLRFFWERSSLTEDDLLIAAGFTYAWMPRILRLDPSAAPVALAALQDAHAGGEPSLEHLTVVATYLSGSVSGASKLLHFAAPERYPIWDSRVARCLGARPLKPMADRVTQYLAYVRLCSELSSDVRASRIQDSVREWQGSRVTVLRALELAMYIAGKA